jgi:hypothetical protein
MTSLLEADQRRDDVVKFRPYRLWSLWDMREHNAKALVRATKVLMRTIVLVDRPDQSPEILKQVLSTLDIIHQQCADTGLNVSATMALEAYHTFKVADKCPNSLIKDELESLHNIIEGELRSILFLQIRPDFARYYNEPRLFGPDVADRFPSAIQDIEEGGKALACGLGTATVFHMMRTMEAGLKALGRSLQIPYAPSWESYLKQIESKISAKHKTKGVRWKKDEPYFKEILGDLQAIKIAWRNPTMHIVRQYSQDEAEDIFRAVRRFMIRLAERHSE